MSGRKPEIEGLPVADRLTAADIIGMDEVAFMDRMQRTGMAAQVDAAIEHDRGHGTGADGGGLMDAIDWSRQPSGQCLVGGSAGNHRGRVLRLMAMPDLSDAIDSGSVSIKDEPLRGPEAWACEGHYRIVREFLDRRTQPRRMAYRDGRQSPNPHQGTSTHDSIASDR